MKFLDKLKEFWRRSKKQEVSFSQQRVYCAHCAHPFTIDFSLSPSERSGTHVTFTIPNPKSDFPTVFSVDMCATCFCFILEDTAVERCACCKKPGCFIIRDRERSRFVGIRFAPNWSQVATVWRDAAGNFYERYKFGENN